MNNPIVALLFNTKLKRWHPIIYREAPLPGPNPQLIRHKSVGHNIEGFEKREDAVAEARKNARTIVERNLSPQCQEALKEDLLWNGEGVPADVAFFVPEPDGTMKRAM